MDYKRNLIIIFAVLLLSACDNRKDFVRTDEIPFTISGIKLGENYSDLKANHSFAGCVPKNTDINECFIDTKKENLHFFFAQTPSDEGYVSLDFDAEHGHLIRITANLNGPALSIDKIEESWKMPYGCFHDYEMKNLIKFDRDLKPVVELLNQFRFFDSHESSFVCVDEQNRYVSYRRGSDGTSHVEMYVLRDYLAGLMRKILDGKARYKQQAIEAQSGQ